MDRNLRDVCRNRIAKRTARGPAASVRRQSRRTRRSARGSSPAKTRGSALSAVRVATNTYDRIFFLSAARLHFDNLAWLLAQQRCAKCCLVGDNVVDRVAVPRAED